MVSESAGDSASCCDADAGTSRFFRRSPRALGFPLRHDREAATALAMGARPKGLSFNQIGQRLRKTAKLTPARREVVSGASFGPAANIQSRRPEAAARRAIELRAGTHATTKSSPSGDGGHSAKGGRHLASCASAWAAGACRVSQPGRLTARGSPTVGQRQNNRLGTNLTAVSCMTA